MAGWPAVQRENEPTYRADAAVRRPRARAERFLHASRERVALAGPDRVWTDVAELERALDAGDAQATLALWSGELLTGLDEDWIYDRHEEFRGRLCEALDAAADEAEAGGDPDTALRLTRSHAALEPLATRDRRAAACRAGVTSRGRS